MTASLIRTEIVPLLEIQDLEPVASDLHAAMVDPRNSDLLYDFPSIVTDFAGSPDGGLEALKESQDECAPGEKEIFVSFVGNKAVGMAGVERPPYQIPEIPSDWPMIWAFVTSPWRGKGIGRSLTEVRLNAVESRYDGKAWAMVRKDNVVSQKNMQRAGFRLYGETSEDDPQFIFAYGS